MSTPRKIHRNLENAIKMVVENKQDYVKNPLVDFTRNRKLTLENTIKLILSMEGGTLKKELLDFSKTHKIDVTSSAFVQQRSKLSYEAFESVLDKFNSLSNDRATFKGYRVFAVNGTDINHFRNPNSDCFMTSTAYPYGYNQTHVNAIFDICNKTYFDVFLQPRRIMDERAALITMLKRKAFSKKTL